MSHFSPILLLLALVMPLFAVSVCDAHSVFMTSEILERAKARIAQLPWASSTYKGIKANADHWMDHKESIPEGPTGWYHDYFCPVHGVRLKYDYTKPHEHVCPEDGKVWTGDKFDAYWRTATHGNIVGAAYNLALVYAIEEKKQYARAAAEILIDYADFYGPFVAAKEKKRIMWQSLDEAVFILKPVKAYELIRDSGVLTDEEKLHIEKDWFLPTALFLKSERKVIHNIHCWYNAAIAALGLVLDDQELVNFDIDGPGAGFRQQISEGVGEDGLWFEGSIGYHFYTLMALENLIIPALNNGIDISREMKVVKKMFLTPILMADAEFVIPPTNDSGQSNLMRNTALYETATYFFPNEDKLAAFLAYSYEHTHRKRSGLEALLYGKTQLPESSRIEVKSTNFSGVGLAVLRKYSGTYESYVMFDYGPHGGGHGHPDKMNVIIAGLGQILAPDTGTAGYGLAINGAWYRQTLSHNTIVVDGQSQSPTTGELLEFHTSGPVQWVSAKAGLAYPGVNWQRTVFLADEGYVVIMDTLKSEGDHVFDWVYHNYGRLKMIRPDMEECNRADFGEATAYQVPRELRMGSTDNDVEAVWELNDGKQVKLRIAGMQGSRIFSAVGPGNPAKIDVPMIVVRRSGKEASFAAVVEPVDGAAVINSLHRLDDGIVVWHRDGTKRFFAVHDGKPDAEELSQ